MRTLTVARSGLVALFLTAAVCVCDRRDAHPVGSRDLVWFLRRLRDVSYLPELEVASTEMESTWDRSNGNTDWSGHSNTLDGDTYTPVDIDGPGCIHRIYTGVVGPLLASTRIEITLDHAATPIIAMPLNEFLTENGGPFPAPLVTTQSYPGSHFPIPFARHARIRLTSPMHIWGTYWQITWTRYPNTTPVETLRLPFTPVEQTEIERVRAAWSLAERSRSPLPSGVESVRNGGNLVSGATSSIDLSGAGVVRELRVKVTPSSATRNVQMRLAWDGVSTPAADISVGDFFGVSAYANTASVPFSSLLMGAADDELWTRLPMPFARGAHIVFENRATFPVQIEAIAEVERLRTVPSNWGRFRVTRNSAPAATSDAPRVQGVPVHNVLDARTRGKYVGVMMQVAWNTTDWWGEGDWLIWTDSTTWPPRYHGTGTEEYFNSGWERFDRKAVSGFITYQPRPVALYSFHLNDAFQFQHSLRVQVETMGHPSAETIIVRDHPAWTTAAFWYAAP
jgi:hypothetical protein